MQSRKKQNLENEISYLEKAAARCRQEAEEWPEKKEKRLAVLKEQLVLLKRLAVLKEQLVLFKQERPLLQVKGPERNLRGVDPQFCTFIFAINFLTITKRKILHDFG